MLLEAAGLAVSLMMVVATAAGAGLLLGPGLRAASTLLLGAGDSWDGAASGEALGSGLGLDTGLGLLAGLTAAGLGAGEGLVVFQGSLQPHHHWLSRWQL
jgi:hypothetical protein